MPPQSSSKISTQMGWDMPTAGNSTTSNEHVFQPAGPTQRILPRMQIKVVEWMDLSWLRTSKLSNSCRSAEFTIFMIPASIFPFGSVVPFQRHFRIMPLIYSLVSRQTQVLAEYTSSGLTGNFSTVTRVLLKVLLCHVLSQFAGC